LFQLEALSDIWFRADSELSLIRFIISSTDRFLFLLYPGGFIVNACLKDSDVFTPRIGNGHGGVFCNR
jgi:hypothetical protein